MCCLSCPTRTYMNSCPQAWLVLLCRLSVVAAVASQQGIPSTPGSPMQSLQLPMQASMSQASGIGGSLRALSQRGSYMDSGWLCQDQVRRRKVHQVVHPGWKEGVGCSCTLNAAL